MFDAAVGVLCVCVCVCVAVACCKASGSPESARQCGTASVVFSVLSVVVAILLVALILIGVYVLHLDFVIDAVAQFSVCTVSQ